MAVCGHVSLPRLEVGERIRFDTSIPRNTIPISAHRLSMAAQNEPISAFNVERLMAPDSIYRDSQFVDAILDNPTVILWTRYPPVSSMRHIDGRPTQASIRRRVVISFAWKRWHSNKFLTTYWPGSGHVKVDQIYLP